MHELRARRAVFGPPCPPRYEPAAATARSAPAPEAEETPQAEYYRWLRAYRRTGAAELAELQRTLGPPSPEPLDGITGWLAFRDFARVHRPDRDLPD